MSWFDKSQEKPKYLMIAKIVEEYHDRHSCDPKDYSMRYEGKIPHEKVDVVLRKMLERIDDEEFVTLREIKRVPNPYSSSFIFGSRNWNYNGFYFYILEEEIPKIDTDEPIHIVCEADKFPKNKEKFLDIVKFFM